MWFGWIKIEEESKLRTPGTQYLVLVKNPRKKEFSKLKWHVLTNSKRAITVAARVEVFRKLNADYDAYVHFVIKARQIGWSLRFW